MSSPSHWWHPRSSYFLDDFATFRDPIQIFQDLGADNDLLEWRTVFEHIVRNVPDLGGDGPLEINPLWLKNRNLYRMKAGAVFHPSSLHFRFWWKQKLGADWGGQFNADSPEVSEKRLLPLGEALGGFLVDSGESVFAGFEQLSSTLSAPTLQREEVKSAKHAIKPLENIFWEFCKVN